MSISHELISKWLYQTDNDTVIKEKVKKIEMGAKHPRLPPPPQLLFIHNLNWMTQQSAFDAEKMDFAM